MPHQSAWNSWMHMRTCEACGDSFHVSDGYCCEPCDDCEEVICSCDVCEDCDEKLDKECKCDFE